MDPVMRLASEEQRNNTALANSSAEPMRPLIWNWAANCSTHSGFSAWAFLMGADHVHPGMTALTLILSFATSRAWERRSEEHTSELQSLMRISYAVFCLKKKKITKVITSNI